ncbi:unnamed protein product [Closterium sp. NIES-54]
MRDRSRRRSCISKERAQTAERVDGSVGGIDCECKPGDCNDVTRGCRGISSSSRSRSPAPSLSPSPSIPSLLSLGFDAVVRKPLRKPTLLGALLPLFPVGLEQGEGAEGRDKDEEQEGGGGGGRGNNDDAARGEVRGRDEGHTSGLVKFSQDPSHHHHQQRCHRPLSIDCSDCINRQGQGQRQWGGASLELVSPSALHKAGSSAAAALWRAVTSPRALMSPQSLTSPQSLDSPHLFKLRRSHSPTTPTTPNTPTTPTTPNTPTTPASDLAKSKDASPVAARNTSPNAKTGPAASLPGKGLMLCEEETSLEGQQQQGMDGSSAAVASRSASLEHLIEPAAPAPPAAAAASGGLASVAASLTGMTTVGIGSTADGSTAGGGTAGGGTASGGSKLTGGRPFGRGTSAGEAAGSGERRAARRSRVRQSDKRNSTYTSGAGGEYAAAANGTLSPAVTTFEAPQKSSSVGTLSPALTRTPLPSLSLAPAPATPPPASQTAAPSALAAATQEPATMGERLGVLAGRRVMVVDDNLINRKVASKLLERHGARVTAVDGGIKALQALAPPHPFHLVLMDLQMPGMDGLEATRRIRARERAQGGGHVAIIALTADVIAGTRHHCFAVGMDDYLSKPLEEAQLSHSVWRCLAHT